MTTVLVTAWCPACQAETPSDTCCPFCTSTVGDDALCPVCRETVAPLTLCSACGILRDDAEGRDHWQREAARLGADREQLANEVQRLRLLLATALDNPTFSVRVACEHLGLNYQEYLLARRIA